MLQSKLGAIAAFGAVSLAVIATSVFLVPARWRPVRSDQGSGSAKARGSRNVSDAVPPFTVRKSIFHRTTTRPGTVRPSEVVDLYPRVSGELRSLSVDVGDRVQQGQVLAVIDSPELRAELRKSRAMVELARARARRVGIAIQVAEATLRAQRAKVDIANAEVKGSEAIRMRREMERKRLKELAERKTLERRLLDEEDKWLESAQEALISKTAQLAVARAEVQAAEGRLESARAEYDEAQAEVRVAEANQASPEMLSDSARVIAPIDGVVSGRNSRVGAVVRTADGAGSAPLLTIVQARRVRIVVEVPDRDAILLDPGDPATFRPDARVDRDYRGTIARTAVAEERGTLRAEIDLENADGQLRPGQAGQVTIALEDRPDVLTVPLSAIPDEGSEAGQTRICYRLVDGRAVRTPIRIGQLNPDTDLAEVLGGLSEGDRVVTDWKDIEGPR